MSSFVIHKHNVTHLHFDFSLDMEDIMKDI